MLWKRLAGRIPGNEWRIVLTVALVQAAYIKPFMGEGQRQYELAESILVDHSLALDETLVRANELDPGRRTADGFLPPSRNVALADRQGLNGDRAYSKGHFYAGVAPGLGVLYLPALSAFRKVVSVIREPVLVHRDLYLGLVSVWLALFVMIPVTVATALCVYRVNRHLVGEGVAPVVLTLLYTFATISFSYGTYVNAWAVMNLCTWVVFCFGLVRPGSPGVVTSGLVGIASAVSVSMNYGAIFLVPLVGLWFVSLYGPKTLALFLAGFTVGIIPLLAYHQVVFGSPLTTSYAHRVDQGVVDIMSHGFQGYGIPSVAVLLQLLVSPRYGFIWYMPILGIALWARPLRGSKIPFWVGLSGMSLVIVLNAARRWDWNAGEGFWGPRYATQAIPYMWLLIVCGLKRAPAAVQVGLGFLSAVINWIGAQYGTNFISIAIAELLLHGHELPVLSWLQRMFFAYTERRPPVGTSGVVILVSLSLAFVWRGRQIVSFWKEHMFPAHGAVPPSVPPGASG